MARVLVTGGTGTLGAAVVDRLGERDHEVRVLSRHPARSPRPRVRYLFGNALTGEGIEEAVSGADAVIYAVSPRSSRVGRAEIDATRRVLAAARGVGAHFVYVSIVGVDRNRFGYYRAKLAAEEVVTSSGTGWSIQRATQFHNLVDWALGLRLFPVTPHLSFQPVDVSDVAGRLTEVVEAGPSGRVEDFGGPEVLTLRQLAAIRQRVTGKRTLLVPLPRVGFLDDFDRGTQLCPDHRSGTVTWEQWLERRQERQA